MNINDYLQNQRAKPTQLSERQSPLTSPDDQLIEFHYNGKVYGLNLNHVQRNIEGELFQPEVINTFKAQIPEIVDRYFDRRVDSSPELGGQRWITTNGISKFFRREIESHFAGAKATQKAIEVAAKRKSEAEHQEIKVYLNPDKVGAGLSTGMRSNKPVDYAVTPSELLEMMQEAIAKPTTIAMRSAVESARFTLIPHVSQRDKIWLKNGIEPGEQDEG